MYTFEFWAALDKLVETSEIVIDRAKGTPHPRYTEYIYPLDYGYLDGTSSMDGEGIDLWLGSLTNLDSKLKIRDITLQKKGCLVKAMVFLVVMYGFESWTIKKAD